MTPTKPRSDIDRLSPQGLEQILRLLVAGQGRRVSSAVVDGRTVWIKRMGAQGRPFFKQLHALVSPLIPWPMLRSSKIIGSQDMALREERKNAAFAAAGFPAVQLLFRQGGNLVLSSASGIVQDELDLLKDTDASAHDDLLVDCAEALGKAHGAGLCHGRPHPRDMILENGRIGFLDFEEAPEETIPLVDAQARDLWLLFLQICGQSLSDATPQRALDAYRADSPPDVLPRLASMRGPVGFLLPFLRLLHHVGLGADGRRLLKASEFLYPALAHTPDQSVPGPLPGQKPKAKQ
ncbi:MAG: serine/threonine protein phosphatase [Rhizobiaceae bacterium]|nr:serine/threonine protein phosphatase [Rhizobiaceae bacterium]